MSDSLLTGTLAEAASASGIAFPVRVDGPDEAGTIVDANGMQVCIVDVERDLEDEQVARIVGFLVRLLNAAGQ
ncbi:hypothetical protein [Sphingomonas jatrophae]|uniref:Uncharacterized protein n=1 Tax=Sphingomonas jatrophae TaxID=1166337 RepID=A0A1I6K6G3_9SPHN|nr:hypothetical protein [Sphingomonas jatrophae]SFR86843.1 hypothetical protein SAMN05192580_1381 [Sphingomonas jatrophae]